MFDKIKQLSKETVIYGISNIVGRFFNFILVPFYSNVFARGDFGEFSLVYAYLSFLNVAFIYGMDASFMKYTSVSVGEEKKTTFSTAWLTVLITSTFFCLLLLGYHDSLREVFKLDLQYNNIVFYVILILFLDTIALIPFADLRLENKPVKFALIKTGNILINLSLNIILILGYGYGIEAIFISNLAASLFSILMLTPEIIKKLQLKISKPALRRLLKFALPYLPGSLAAMFVQVIDVPIIEMLAGKETLGLYRANYKLGIFIMLFVSMFNYAWQPFFLNNAKEKNAKEIFSKVFTLFLIVLSLVWVVLTLFTEDIAKIEFHSGMYILGENYHEGLIIIPIILLAYVFYGMYSIFTAGIYIQEKTKYFPIVTGAGAVVNVIANFILVPQIGIMGGAIATLMSYVVMAAGLYYFSQKCYRIDYEYAKVGKLIALILIVIVSYYYLHYIGILNLTIKFLILFGFLSSFIVLKIISFSELKPLLKKLNIKR
ncbi:MAG: polysaccharide biosynthesis C-terminal domain-containing protein [Bacteroidetes bacterium]|nr:polysaccharide biosynthesis C-terminal domain-containing protein [Bacteroidota bacterium]